MGSLFVLLVLIVVVLVVIALLKGQQTGPSTEMTYETRNALFSPAAAILKVSEPVPEIASTRNTSIPSFVSQRPLP